MVRLLFLLAALVWAPAPPPIWAAFGDAATAGVDVPPAVGYIGRLGATLGAIDNQAQEGADTQAQVVLMQGRPLRAVIWLPGGRDLQVGRSSAEYRAALDAGLALLAAQRSALTTSFAHVLSLLSTTSTASTKECTTP
mgnify:CR=1 FL=1